MDGGQSTHFYSFRDLQDWWNKHFQRANRRYPSVTLDGLKSLNPDVIFLSSEPFSFNETHLNELKMNGIHQPIVDINGEILQLARNSNE